MRSAPLIFLSRSIAALTLTAGLTGPAHAVSIAYSSFLGGAGATEDQAFAIAVDDNKNAYVTGTTNSPDFPSAVGGPIQAAKNAGYDIFVTKINPAGTAIVWSAYLGGATEETGLGIAVDGPSGRAYITGSVSGGANIPASAPMTGAVGVLAGLNAFVVGFAADGQSTTFRVTFGADGDDVGNGIAIDSGENLYVTGTATAGSVIDNTPHNALITTFPTTADASPCAGTRSVSSQAFVMKFTSGGAQVYGTYLGCTGFANGRGIAVDGSGRAYVTGNTGDGLADAAIAGAFKPTWGGGSGEGDAFAARLLADGSSFDYKTYIGGANDDQGNSIAVDSLNDVYLTGYTFSADFPDNSTVFATVPGLGGGRTTMSTGPDAFVMKLRMGNGGGHSDGVYATYLGGNTDDRATGIAVDSSFNAYVAGHTTSGDFPSVGSNPAAGQSTFIGSPEAFVTVLSNTGGPLAFSTWLGGTGPTKGQGLALDSLKNIYVTGYTGSLAGTFPLVAGGFQQTRGTGTNTAFVTKFAPVSFAAGEDLCGTGYFFPSPARGAVGNFRYCMASAGRVKIRVYNVIGDLVAKVEEYKIAGSQHSPLNTGRLAPGVYLYLLERNYDNGGSNVSNVKKFVVQH
ncbi:MAG: hypothetical protein A2X31_04505 [Elusimicrobia bacterium GWB2_63_22]|nr:MAG: hypothetical protein A2X31_04505 [Elusimicrobia bacterium GWB2_63_22]